MTKTKKIIFGLLGVVVLGVVAVLVSLNTIIEKMRPRIEESISRSIGAELRVGAIETQLSPFGMGLQGVSINSPDGQPVAKLERLTLTPALMPLLSGRFVVHEFLVDGFTAKIVRNKAGVISLPTIGAPKEKTASPDAATTEEAKSAPSLEVERARITNSSIIIRDEKALQPVEIPVSDIDATLSQIDLAQQRATIDISLKLFSSGQSANFKISGDLANPLTGGKPSFDLKWNDIALGQVKNIAAAYQPLPADLVLDGTTNFQISGKQGEDALKLSVRFDGSKSHLKLGEMFQKPVDTRLLVEGDVLAGLLEAKSENLRLQIGKSSILAPFRAQPNGSLAADVSLEQFDLAELAQLVPPLAQAQAKGNVGGKIHIEKSGASPQPTFKGTIDLNGLGISIGEPQPKNISNVSGKVQFEGTTVTLNPLTGSINQQPFDLQTKVVMAPEALTIEPSVVKAFAGALNFRGVLKKTTPEQVGFSADGRGFEVARLLTFASPGNNAGLSGTVDSTSLTLAAQKDNFLPTAKGPIKFSVINGALEKLNIIGKALEGLREIPVIAEGIDKYLPSELLGDKTAFDRLDMSSEMGNNQLNISRIDLIHRLYEIRGNGTVSFPSNMKIRAQLKLTPTLTQNLVTKQPKLNVLLDREKNIVFPIIVSREGESTRVVPDLEDLLKRAATNTAKEAAGRALDKVAPGLGKALDSLF